MSTWTVERVEAAKKLFLDGLSAAQIASELGGITRNAVIGLAHRRGWKHPNGRNRGVSARAHLPPRRDRRIEARAASIQARAAGILGRRFDAVERLPQRAELARDPNDAATIPVEQRKTLIGLTSTTCKWGYGDPGTPEFFFCGGGVVDGRPYCLQHCVAAYEPPKPPRRKCYGQRQKTY